MKKPPKIKKRTFQFVFLFLDRPKCQANRPYVRDLIKIFAAPKRLDKNILRQKYVESNLSSAQIGEEFGLSKQAVLRRLRAAGIFKSEGRGRSKDNFRFPNPTYGHRVVRGRLESNPSEMKIVRLIVELRDRQQWNFTDIAEELCRKGFVTRQGAQWKRHTVGHVYRVWAGKL